MDFDDYLPALLSQSRRHKSALEKAIIHPAHLIFSISAQIAPFLKTAINQQSRKRILRPPGFSQLCQRFSAARGCGSQCSAMLEKIRSNRTTAQINAAFGDDPPEITVRMFGNFALRLILALPAPHQVP